METNAMSPARRYEALPLVMLDPKLCHYCHKNKLDPKDEYFLPNGIEVCKQCTAQERQSAMRSDARPRG